jgi:hypothetical protein
MAETIDSLIEKGAALNGVSKFGCPAVFAAVEGCNADIVLHLLSSHHRCRSHLARSYPGSRGILPLHYAIMQDSREIFDILLAHGAPLDGSLQACAMANHASLYYAQKFVDENAPTTYNFLAANSLFLSLCRPNIPLASLLVQHYPELLETRIIERQGFTNLDGVVLFTVYSGRPDFRALTFIFEQNRIHDVRLPSPPLNEWKADPLEVAVVSSWGHRRVESIESDRSEIDLLIVAVAQMLITAYPDVLDGPKAVDAAVTYRNLPVLRFLLGCGMGCNYCSKVGDSIIGRSTMDAALRSQKQGAPAVVKAAGSRAAREYEARTEEMVQILRHYGAMTHFEMRGWELYGERTGYILFGGAYRTMWDDAASELRRLRRNTRSAVDRNVRYF